MATLTSVIDTSIKRPGSFIQVSLGVGARSPGSGAVKVLLTGNKTSAGTQAVEVPVQLFTVNDAKTYFGAGSELHLMAKAAFKANPLVELYAVAITAAGTAADEDVVFASTATAAGTFEIWVAGERIVLDIAVGDTHTATATALAAAINAKTDWPVTASVSSGTVTVTAKNTGPRGNTITLRTKLTSVTGLTHTPLNTKLSSGATMDDPQNALDAVAASRYHLIVSPHSSTTELNKYKTHANTYAGPLNGRRQRVVAASVDTLSNSLTVSDAVNGKLVQIAWLEDSDDCPSWIAAATAAYVAGELGKDRASNLDGSLIPGLKNQDSAADIPTASEINSALNRGLTPLLSTSDGVRIIRSITNYHLDAASNPDYSVLDTHYVDVPFFVADDLEVNFAPTFAGFKIAPDGEDGAPPAPKVATPKSVRDWVFGRLKTYENRLLVNVDALQGSLITELDPSAPGRINVFVPVDCIELFHQGGFEVAQIG